MRIIHRLLKSRFLTFLSRYANLRARSTVSLAVRYKTPRPPRYPFAAERTFLRLARDLTAFLTLGIEISCEINLAGRRYRHQATPCEIMKQKLFIDKASSA